MQIALHALKVKFDRARERGERGGAPTDIARLVCRALSLAEHDETAFGHDEDRR